MIATSKSGAERGRQRRPFFPQPVPFNLKGKVKPFQKLLLLRFGLDPPGIRKFSFLLVMRLKMKTWAVSVCLHWMRETEEEEGGEMKEKFHRCNASWHPKRHSCEGFGKNNHTCLYNLFKLWVTTGAQCARFFPFATPDGSRFITHECDNLWDCFVSEWHIYVKRGFR